MVTVQSITAECVAKLEVQCQNDTIVELFLIHFYGSWNETYTLKQTSSKHHYIGSDFYGVAMALPW